MPDDQPLEPERASASIIPGGIPWAGVIQLGILAFLVVFLVYPILYIFPASIKDNVNGPHGPWTFTYYWLVFRDPFLVHCLVNSLLIATISTVLTTVVTLPLAVWYTQYTFRGKAWLSGLLLVPMVLPPFVGALGVQRIFARFGAVNILLMKLGWMHRPIDWFGAGGFWGVVALEVLHLYPIMYLNVAAALANIDPTLQEAARNLGSSEWQVFRRITFPLMRPGYFAGAAIVFVWAFTDLGTPLVFNFRRVIPLQIFDKILDAETNPLGYALVVVTLIITGVLFLLARGAVGRGRYEMMARGGIGSTAQPAGRGRTVVIVGFTGLLTALAVVPHVGVVLTALARRWSFSVLPTAWTMANFGAAIRHPMAGRSILNSLTYSLGSTAIDILIGLSVAYLVTRRPTRLGRLLDTLTMLPLALPGLVLAFGYLTCYNLDRLAETVARRHWSSLADSLHGLSFYLDPQKFPVILLVIAYAVRRLPYMTRAAAAGLQQTSVSMEEAAESLGASRWRTLRTITLPLIASSILAGAVLTFAFAMLEVSDSLMLAQQAAFYPITKAIDILLARPDDGPYIASALGVVGMLILTASLVASGAVLSRRMGELFRV